MSTDETSNDGITEKIKILATDDEKIHSYAEIFTNNSSCEILQFLFNEESPIHIRHISLQGDKNNNKMERLNGEFRDREKIMSGVKKTDSVIFDGCQLYHNYVRPHMTLKGKTSAKACGIVIKDDNKWLTLIQSAKSSQKD